ncbi:MAG: hypothetical protein ABFD89_29810 [Bryobacteraceae bacterium]
MKRLHEMYLAITKLSADEVVAAYQTVSAIAQAMNLSQDPMVQNLFKALESHMTFIAARAGRMSGQAERFFEVTGSYKFKRGLADLFG